MAGIKGDSRVLGATRRIRGYLTPRGSASDAPEPDKGASRGVPPDPGKPGFTMRRKLTAPYVEVDNSSGGYGVNFVRVKVGKPFRSVGKWYIKIGSTLGQENGAWDRREFRMHTPVWVASLNDVELASGGSLDPV